MSVITRDIPLTTREAIARPMATRTTPPTVVVTNDAQQWRGMHALRQADRILRQAAAPLTTREDVTPEMEPDNASLTTEEPGEDFTDNEDVTDDMEPFDATIESALKATVTGDEDSVTITAEEGETIVAVTDDDDDVHVDIEDTADVLLGFKQ